MFNFLPLKGNDLLNGYEAFIFSDKIITCYFSLALAAFRLHMI